MNSILCSTEETNFRSIRYFEDTKRIFCYSDISETIHIDNGRPFAEQIISTLTDPEIISVKIVNTVAGHSYEGEYSTGKKALIRLKVKEKILYTSTNESQTIHVIENEFFHSTSLVIPRLIEGTEPELLLKHNYLKLNIKVEDVNIRTLSPELIFKYVCLSLELLLIPTFELCYSMQENKSGGKLFLSYENYSFNTKMSELENSFDSKPSWSPVGEDIAFISHRDGTPQLCSINIKSLNKRELTDPGIIKTISDYCWTADGRNIIFASSQNGIRDLFILDLQNNNFRQLTYGNSNVKYYFPRCSPDGMHIGFLKNVSGVVNLYMQSIGGGNYQRLTSSGHIKDFSWSSDGKRIAVIRDRDGNPDEILIIDIAPLDEKVINLCKCANRKRSIRFSPDDRFITIIGTVYDIDDVYLIDIMDNTASNITKNPAGVSISSYCWNADSNKLFYSSNIDFHFNIYSFSIFNKTRQQLTNSKSTGIYLDYRLKIK